MKRETFPGLFGGGLLVLLALSARAGAETAITEQEAQGGPS
jgi:hypothetical protein